MRSKYNIPCKERHYGNIFYEEDPFSTRMSFTVYHWLVMDSYLEGRVPIEDISNELLKQICFNIYPAGENIISKIWDKEKMVVKLYSRYKQIRETSDPIPFIKNQRDETPLHLSKAMSKTNLLDLYLRELSEYPFAYCTRYFIDILPELFDVVSASVSIFLNSRMQTNEYLEMYKMGNIKNFSFGVEFGLYNDSFLPVRRNEFEERVFEEGNKCPINVHALDLYDW
jgi:hypothetical protein